MIRQFFSTESRKAWVAGVLGALLSPVFELLAGSGEITLRTLGVALGSGAVTAIATYATTNAPGPLPWQAEPAALIGGLPTPYEVDDTPGRHAADA